jgi:hypothetical protein
MNSMDKDGKSGLRFSVGNFFAAFVVLLGKPVLSLAPATLLCGLPLTLFFVTVAIF